MKTKYRKFAIGRGKYSFWLRYKQTLTKSVIEHSKMINTCIKQQHKKEDYYHSQRRTSKRLREVLLGLSRAITDAKVKE